MNKKLKSNGFVQVTSWGPFKKGCRISVWTFKILINAQSFGSLSMLQCLGPVLWSETIWAKMAENTFPTWCCSDAHSAQKIKDTFYKDNSSICAPSSMHIIHLIRPSCTALSRLIPPHKPVPTTKNKLFSAMINLLALLPGSKHQGNS